MKQLDPDIHHELHGSEEADGWRIVELDRRQFKYKEWRTSGEIEGVPHSKGDKKRTWEVIRDAGLASYNITQNPTYQDALQAANMSYVRKQDKHKGGDDTKA